MATLETIYEVWFKRQNPKEGESSQQLWQAFNSVTEAKDACLMLAEENVNIWKVHKICEHLETLK